MHYNRCNNTISRMSLCAVFSARVNVLGPVERKLRRDIADSDFLTTAEVQVCFDT